MLFLSKKIDMKDPQIILYAQIGLTSVVSLILLIHAYVYFVMNSKSKDDEKKIWVPPKPKPQLPFNLGPAPEPVKPEEYEHTTYKEYETKLLRESVFSVLMSFGISMFMSFKFNVHVSLLMQSVMTPMGLLDNLVLKKYILGSKNPRIYNEEFAEPTVATIAAAAAAAAAANPSITDEAPRAAEPPAEVKETKKDK
jgi:hypothetical protein